MNVVYLTFSSNIDIKSHGVHIDLMKKMRDEKHNVYIVCPLERREKKKTSLEYEEGIHILRVWSLNLKRSNFIEKGLGTILVESQFSKAIKRYLPDVHFDLILYSTPPITFPRVIKELKQANKNAYSYLLLKDIFPQNAVDLGMLKQGGFIYRYFRKKEIQLYKSSDFIGCMSPANVSYLLKHNSFINKKKVEVAPNSLIPQPLSSLSREVIRAKYGIPNDKPVFIYGGNLGKPQGIDFLIKCLNDNLNRNDCHFVIIGSGVDYPKVEAWYQDKNPINTTLLKGLPVKEYNLLVQSCDIGLIFLDYRFTIPNFPARLLSYMEFHMPVLAVTDVNSDVGEIAESNKFGFWCPSNDKTKFMLCVNRFLVSDYKAMGEKAYDYFISHYTVTNTYNVIFSHF